MANDGAGSNADGWSDAADADELAALAAIAKGAPRRRPRDRLHAPACAGPTAPPSDSSASRSTRRSAATGSTSSTPTTSSSPPLALTSVQAKEVGSLLELRVRSGDGWRLVEMIGAPLGDDVVLSVRDLTERRRWEVAGDEVARFRSLMQNAASVTMLLTRDGIVESSSGGLTRMLGLDQEWLEQRPLADVVDEADHDGARRRAARTCSTPSPALAPAPVTIDVRFRHASGTTVPVRAHVHQPARRSDRRRTRRDRARHHRPRRRGDRAARGELGAGRDARVDRRRHPRGRRRRAASRAWNSRFAEMWQHPA